MVAVNCFPVLCAFVVISSVHGGVLDATTRQLSSDCLRREEISKRTNDLVVEVEKSKLTSNAFTNCVNLKEADILEGVGTDKRECINPRDLGNAIKDNCLQYVGTSDAQVVRSYKSTENADAVAKREWEREDSRGKRPNANVLRITELVSTLLFSSRPASAAAHGGSSKPDLPNTDISLLDKATVRSSCATGGYSACEFVCCQLAASYGVSRQACYVLC